MVKLVGFASEYIFEPITNIAISGSEHRCVNLKTARQQLGMVNVALTLLA